MALFGLWGSMFSRKRPSGLKLPRRFRSQLRLEVGEPVPAEQASSAELERRVRQLLGEPGSPQPTAAE
jgi:hypothetical protein